MKGYFSSLVYLLRKSPFHLAGFVVIVIFLMLMLVGPQIAPYPPEAANPADYLMPPGTKHWLGTDKSGMDIFSRVIAAPRTDLSIGIAATILATLIGAPLGVIAAFFRERGGDLIVRVLDVLQAFPVFVLGMALVAVAGQNIVNVIYAIAFLNTPLFMRLVRSQAISVREKPFIEAARCVGNSDMAIMFRHLFPNAVAPAFIQASVTVGIAILLTAGLSFVGAGVRVPTPEWGSMIAVGAPNIMTGEWWPSVFPGAAVSICVFGFALVGDALQRVYEGERV